MRKAEVEIYSDQSNYAVMRHPGRNFPGALNSGRFVEDTLPHRRLSPPGTGQW